MKENAPPPNAPTLLDSHQLAKMLRIRPSTTRKARVTGGGPPYLMVGRRILYLEEDVIAWLKTRRVESTSAPKPRPITEGETIPANRGPK